MDDLFSNFIYEELGDNADYTAGDRPEISKRDIAIIGMAVKLPGAENLDAFWQLCAEGRDCIGAFPESRKKDTDAYLDYMGISPHPYLDGAYLDNISGFDYSFFNLSPKEASLMNPCQRLFLEKSWEAIENAGYGGDRISGSRTGVYVGYIGDMEGYRYRSMVQDAEKGLNPIAVPGNLASIIPGRISYLLDLRGPSMLVDTACSSSLVAVHLACESIRSGKCDMALAGGIKLYILPLNEGVRIGIESSDGRTRSFDDQSDGTGIGEGAGVVLLKPLYRALEDGDNIHAVIKGSAVNQDGKSAGITAPRTTAQTELLIDAWMDAGIDPGRIAYLEAHGTGTRLGDPVEIEGITQAFNKYTQRKQFCAIGSVKSNLGHLYEAAGIIGLIKSALAMKHRQLPPSIHFTRPNREIRFEQSPVFLNNRLREWPDEHYPRLSGVSSFGFNGTNCHVVLEEAPAAQPGEPSNDALNLLALSAKSMSSLRRLAGRYLSFLATHPMADLRDLCYTANTGRGHYACRLILMAESLPEVSDKLEKLTHSSDWSGLGPGIFFSGQDNDNPDNSTSPGQDLYSKKLQHICESYIRGIEVNWDLLYRQESRKRVELPAYPFDPRTCWPEFTGSNLEGRSLGQGTDGRQIVLTGRPEGETYSRMEETVGKIWGETLGYKELNIHHSLFSLGADSIAILRLANRMSEELRIELPFAQLIANPTIAHCSAQMEAFPPPGNGLINGEPSGFASIPHVEDKAWYAASAAQERMYALSQLVEGSTVYHVTGAVDFSVSLDMDKLNAVFRELIERHEILRTSFRVVHGKPVQYVHEPGTLAFALEEYPVIQEHEITAVAERFVRPFELGKAPLFRVAAVHFPEDRTVLIVDMHHIITDGTSMETLTREIGLLYAGNRLKPLKHQYKDYSSWQQNNRNTAGYRGQEKYWLQEFAEMPQVLELNPDVKRPAVQSFQGAEITFTFDRELTEQIKNLARRLDCTVFMILLATLNVLLAKQSGQSEIVIGCPVSGREHPDLAGMLGLMVNTIAIKNIIGRDDSFASLAEKTRIKTLQAYSNQAYQFDDLVDKVMVHRNPGASPVFTVMFVLQNMPVIQLGNVQSRPFKLNKTSEMFDLSFVAAEADNEICFSLTYATSLFTRPAIGKMADRYRKMVEQMIAGPEILLEHIEFMSAEEADRYNRNSAGADVIEADFAF
ncbi:polyketide synthase [Paenibacillus sp. PK3_47]|uniref:condensation domain-containing protein n=1 Tax=Paenibacillus sp. PK3_47 TaxID=2072642 RepID=UPI00201D6DC9|nr:condensation domain-containing protein [Paenibacillus sp. PK3_47]UQZ35483.1 polyketide synthase [Paenibacillus sp. PK3_47]